MSNVYSPTVFRVTPSVATGLWPKHLLTALTVATSLLPTSQSKNIRAKISETESSIQPRASCRRLSLVGQKTESEKSATNVFQKLNAIRELQVGWDTYGSEPPAAKSCDVAQVILEASQNYSLPIVYLMPTSDGSLLLRHEIGRTSVTWEVDGDGEIGLMIERIDNEPTFHSLPDTRIESFVASLAWNV